MISDEILMAYADGELDAVLSKRVAHEIGVDSDLARQVDAHRALRATIASAFVDVAEEPVPERLQSLVTRTVLPFRSRERLARGGWAAALAASLVLGVGLGAHLGNRGDIVERDGSLTARGALAQALDRQPANAAGATRILVSFEDRDGRLCRVFDAGIAGIACREPDRWAIIRARPSATPAASATYRQAGSPDGTLLAEAQEMMIGEPLDAVAETKALKHGWHLRQTLAQPSSATR